MLDLVDRKNCIVRSNWNRIMHRAGSLSELLPDALSIAAALLSELHCGNSSCKGNSYALAAL